MHRNVREKKCAEGIAGAVMVQVKVLKRTTLTSTISDYYNIDESWKFIKCVISKIE